MGEARRRSEQGLPPKTSKENTGGLFSQMSNTQNLQEKFFAITKTGSWIGIGILIIFWITVRFIGPSAGWWIPADVH